MPPGDLLLLIPLGLVAGALGGLLGIGGSIVIIPVLVLGLGRDFHIAQASAMIINVCVAVPAVLRHHGMRRVEWRLVGRLLPASLVLILVGVQVSRVLDGKRLEVFFGLFLLYVAVLNARRLLWPPPGGEESQSRPPRVGWSLLSMVGAINGFAAGLLGIGGGIIAVPLLQGICRIALRRAIVLSSATMVLTATVGAIRKNWLLPTITVPVPADPAGQLLPGVAPDAPVAAGMATAPLEIADSLITAAALCPGAVVGALVGATLTHRAPLGLVRAIFLVLITVAAVRMISAA